MDLRAGIDVYEGGGDGACEVEIEDVDATVRLR